MKKRCPWSGSNKEYIHYHDKNWGVPLYADNLLFEMLTLEGAQAGLSWLTILKKRTNYRLAFDNYRLDIIADYTDKDVSRLCCNSGIIRNRLKIKSVIKNARATLEITAKHGSLSNFLWQFTDGRPIQNSWKDINSVPVETDRSRIMSKELKKWGFSFVGPIICYSFMQSTGMVNDHLTNCFRYEEIRKLSE